MPIVIIASLLLAVIAPAVAHAQVQVHVDIGFRLPEPPRMVVVAPVPTVRYVQAPAAPGNLFFYNGQYWAFAGGGWYVSGGYNGPWVVVAPAFVPRPVLLVPVQYYHVPPGHWKKWAKHRPPHWQEDWGRQWADKREWKSRDGNGDQDDDRGKGRGKGKGRGQGREG